MEYKKTCKDPRCKKPFVSTSRNAAYCCDECRQRHAQERIKRRKAYKTTASESHIIARAYKLANEIADIFYPEKICACCGKPSTHVHHRDVNVLNNSPENLLRVCEPCHKKLHSSLPNVNMVTTLNECRTLKQENSAVDTVKMFSNKFKREEQE